jgi:K+-transporting ATPase KdpF subunit
LRTPEVRRSKFMLGNIVLIVICVLLLGYLLVALLKPEKF